MISKQVVGLLYPALHHLVDVIWLSAIGEQLVDRKLLAQLHIMAQQVKCLDGVDRIQQRAAMSVT